MRQLNMAQAIQEAIAEEMRRDDRVYVMGEAVGPGGTAPTRHPEELMKEFGERRVRETGIIEPTLGGSAMGAALAGYRPIIDFMMADFMFPAWSEIYDSGVWRAGHGAAEDMKIPLVYMAGLMGYGGGGFSHSRCPTGNVMHIPGMKIAVPTTPYDAKGLLKTAIRDDNPVTFLTHRFYYPIRGDVPEEEFLVPFGQAAVRREGKDITIVGIGWSLHLALEAAEDLEKEGVSAEVIDPRTLEPLDIDTIVASVQKTGHLVVADEDMIRCGPHAEIAFQVQERAFRSLRCPVFRIGNPNYPIPTARNLIEAVLPTKARIIDAARKCATTSIRFQSD